MTGVSGVYEPIDYENKNEKTWKQGIKYVAPGQSHVNLVYQVPEDEKEFVIFVSGENFAKTITVKIDLKK